MKKISVLLSGYIRFIDILCHTRHHCRAIKGVGFANNYPIPSHREGGDIDIFTYSADSSGLSDREANSLADKLMRGRGIEVDFSHSQSTVCFIIKVFR